MPFPNANFSVLSSTNFGAAGPNNGGPLMFFREKEHFKAQGWTISRSGDGLAAFSSSGDVIASSANGANGVNDNAWYVIRRPDGVEFMRTITAGATAGGATGFSFQWAVSPTGVFAGGSAAVPATASDQGLMPARVYSNVANNTAIRHSHFGVVETEAPYRFFFLAVRDDITQSNQATETQPIGGFILESQLQYPYSEDDNPFRYILIQSGTSGTPFGTDATNDWDCFAYIDSAPPATSANFIEFIFENLDAPNTNTVPFDAGGLATAPTELRRQTGTPVFILPPCSMIRVKKFLDGATINARRGEVPSSMGGSDGVFGDSYMTSQLCFPWDPNETIWTDATAPVNYREYPFMPYSADEFVNIGGPNRFRMRGVDTTLAQEVYWTANSPDPDGNQYTGPGPLTGVIVSDILGD